VRIRRDRPPCPPVQEIVGRVETAEIDCHRYPSKRAARGLAARGKRARRRIRGSRRASTRDDNRSLDFRAGGQRGFVKHVERVEKSRSETAGLRRDGFCDLRRDGEMNMDKTVTRAYIPVSVAVASLTVPMTSQLRTLIERGNMQVSP